MNDMAYFKVYKKILGSKIMECHANTLKAFIVCLALANWKDGEAGERGTFKTTLRDFSRISRLSVQSVRATWANLEKLGIITRRATQEATHVMILKYGFYQSPPTQNPTHEPTNGATHDPTNQNKEVKNNRKDVKSARAPAFEGTTGRRADGVENGTAAEVQPSWRGPRPDFEPGMTLEEMRRITARVFRRGAAGLDKTANRM